MAEQQALVDRNEEGSGRAVSSQNARKHGILAEGVTAAEEDQMARVAAAFHDDLRPVGMVESALVEKIALTYLQLQRCARAEAALFEAAWRPNCPQHYSKGELGTGSNLHVHPLEQIANLIARYDTTLTNRMLKLLQTLATRQILRGQASPERPAPALPQAGDRSPKPGGPSGDEAQQTVAVSPVPNGSEREPCGAHGGAEWWPEGVSRNEQRTDKDEPDGSSQKLEARSERTATADVSGHDNGREGGRAAPDCRRQTASSKRGVLPNERPQRPADGFWREEPEGMPNRGRRRW